MMQAKKVCWFVGVIVVMCLLPKVKAVNNTTSLMSMSMPTSMVIAQSTTPMPTTTITITSSSVVSQSPSGTIVEPPPTSTPSPTSTDMVVPSTSAGPIVDPSQTSTPSPTSTVMVVPSTSAAPTPKPTPPPTMKLNLEIKIKGDRFDNATNGAIPKNITEELCRLLKEISKVPSGRIKECKILGIRKAGSVVVEYELIVYASSREEAQEVINAIQDQVNTGEIGNYKVAPEHPLGAKITMTVDGTPVTEAPKTIDSTTLIILLGVGLFLLVVVIILLVFLFIKLRKG